jgi:hypothetical protein
LAMKKNPLLEFTSEDAGMIKKCRPTSLNKKTLAEMTGSFLISQKDGRYKVEVTNIRTIPMYTVEIYGVKSTEQDSPLELSTIDKKGEFKEFFVDNYSKPMDILFSSFFDPKKKKEDW